MPASITRIDRGMIEQSGARSLFDLLEIYVPNFHYLPHHWEAPHMGMRGLIGDRDEADDLLQDVFVKAYQHLADFDTARKFSPWIYRIAHNEAVNWIRKRSRRPVVVSWDDIVETTGERQSIESAETVEEQWIRRELRDDVRVALGRLNEEHREILTLRYYLDKSYREIAEIVGVPMNTVASRVSRAKRSLLDILGGKGV
jgi:RNA polymerase sigma-70 factor (ECF subfamily)